MKTYIALLRGINVSGQKIIIMSDLRGYLEEVGLKKVQTYIQSGNIIFESAEVDPEKLKHIIFQKIMDKYGFEVPIIIITPNDLEFLLNNNPFLYPEVDNKKLFVAFLKNIPEPGPVQEIQKIAPPGEKLVFLKKYIFLYYGNGAGQAKMTNNFFEQKLKLKSTTRNWNTINKLYKMALQG